MKHRALLPGLLEGRAVLAALLALSLAVTPSAGAPPQWHRDVQANGPHRPYRSALGGHNNGDADADLRLGIVDAAADVLRPRPPRRARVRQHSRALGTAPFGGTGASSAQLRQHSASLDPKAAAPVEQQKQADQAEPAKPAAPANPQKGQKDDPNDPLKDDPNWFVEASTSILQFYLYLYGCVGIVYLMVHGCEVFKIVAPKLYIIELMHQIAIFYGHHSILAPLLATGALFGIGDIIAQRYEDYWEEWPLGDTPDNDRWHFRITLSIVLTAALLHGLALNEAYMQLESRLVPPRDLVTGLVKVAKLLGFYCGWLVVYAILFGTVAGTVDKVTSNVANDCVVAAVYGVPWHLKDSLVLHGGLYFRTLACSWMFWTPSHCASFWVTQRWAPQVRTTWDGFVAMLWNVHVLRGAGGPIAMGPLLSGVAPVSYEAQSYADCSSWSLWAILTKVWEWTKYLVCKTWDGITFLFGNFWKCCKWSWCRLWYWFRSALYWVWYLVLWVYIIIRVLLWLAILIIFKALALIFGIWDTVKGMLFLGFIPAMFPYESCPYCPIYPPADGWPGSLAPSSPQMPDWCFAIF